jgi:hypothetical protein
MKNTVHRNLHLIPNLNFRHQHILHKHASGSETATTFTFDTRLLLDKKRATIKHYLNTPALNPKLYFFHESQQQKREKA